MNADFIARLRVVVLELRLAERLQGYSLKIARELRRT